MPMRAHKKRKAVKKRAKRLSKPKKYETFTVRIPMRLYERWKGIPEAVDRPFSAWVFEMMEISLKRAEKFHWEALKRIKELLPDKEETNLKQDKYLEELKALPQNKGKT